MHVINFLCCCCGSLFTPAITRCINNYLLKTLERNRSLLVSQHMRRWFICFHGLCLRLASLKHDHDVPQIFHDVFCRSTNSIVYLCYSNWVSEFEKLVIKLLKHAQTYCLTKWTNYNNVWIPFMEECVCFIRWSAIWNVNMCKQRKSVKISQIFYTIKNKYRAYFT